MMDEAEMLRVEEIGGPRRDVREADEASCAGCPLGERRHLERATGRAPHMLAEVGLADVSYGEDTTFHQGHAITMQAVPRRMAAGRDRRRRDTRHRWKDRMMVDGAQA